MKGLKKVACMVVMGALVLCMNVGMVFAKDTSNLKLVVENCNVSILKTSETEISYSYDSSKFIVNHVTSDSTEIITIKIKDGAAIGLFDRVTVNVPSEKYNKIILENKNAGVSLPEINTNYDVTCNGGSVNFKMIDGYNKIFNCNIQSGSGSLKFASGTKDYTVNLDVANSSISVPSTFTKYTSGQKTYCHINGNGTAQFNIGVTGSAFSIKCE